MRTSFQNRDAAQAPSTDRGWRMPLTERKLLGNAKVLFLHDDVTEKSLRPADDEYQRWMRDRYIRVRGKT